MKKNFTLSTIKSGALEEIFQDELEKVIENIKDVNTNAKTKRTIDIKLTFVPSVDREDVQTVFQVKSKLAPFEAQEAHVYISKEDGENVAFEHERGVIKNQLSLSETAKHQEENDKEVVEKKVVNIN